MHTPLLMKKLSSLQVSPPEINSSLLYEAFTVSKAFQFFLLNKYHLSFKHLFNKVSLLSTLMIFYSSRTLKNTCSNLLNNYILLAQRITLNSPLKNHFSCFSKSNFWDMKLATIQSNPYIPKFQLYTKFLHPLEKLLL